MRPWQFSFPRGVLAATVAIFWLACCGEARADLLLPLHSSDTSGDETPVRGWSILRLPKQSPWPAAAAGQTPPADQPATDSTAGSREENPEGTDAATHRGRDRDDDRRGDGRRGHHGHHHQHGGLWLLWPSYVYYPPFFGPYYGWTNPFQAPRLASNPAPAAVDPPAPRPAPSDLPKAKVRATSAAWKARAGKFIGYGDTNFGKQSYLAAVERYKTAAQMAPDVAEPYLRQGFAFVAMGNYPSAARAFRRGLAIRSDWTDTPFRLDEIYDDQIAKTAHLETLAKAVETNPLDADLLMLLGLQIFFDGQPQRAEVFFARAAQLGGNEDGLLDSFLPRPGPAGAPKPAADAPKAGGKIVF
jgi:hypothetical protein